MSGCIKQHRTSSSDTKSSFNWERILRKISEGHTKTECKYLIHALPLAKRKIKHFPTESSYEGTWNILGMSGHGVYKFPSSTKYEGEFDDGEFHGEGKMTFANGAVIHGKWHRGELVERKVILDNGIIFDEHDWMYCKMPDRRFHVEYEQGLKPAGESHMTAKVPAPDIPLGMYDTGDGFYDPTTKLVHDYKNYEILVRAPHEPEQKWITKCCRYNPMMPLGPQPQLYEQWQPLLDSGDKPLQMTKRASEIKKNETQPTVQQSKQSEKPESLLDSEFEKVYYSESKSSIYSSFDEILPFDRIDVSLENVI